MWVSSYGDNALLYFFISTLSPSWFETLQRYPIKFCWKIILCVESYLFKDRVKGYPTCNSEKSANGGNKQILLLLLLLLLLLPKTLHRIKFGCGQNLCNTWQIVQSTGCCKHPLPSLFLVKWMRDKRLGTPKDVCVAAEASSKPNSGIFPVFKQFHHI